MASAKSEALAAFSECEREVRGSDLSDPSYVVNPKNYEKLIRDLVDETAFARGSRPNVQYFKAWKQYFAVAIGKGADLSTLPAALASLPLAAIDKAGQSIPDRQGRGWRGGVTSLTAADRKAFAEAERRREKFLWDQLFGNKNDVILPLVTDARSFTDKIGEFIDRHNSHAEANFVEAQRMDASRPDTKPRAGRDISHQLIRRDPHDPAVLQIYKPKITNGKPDGNPREGDWTAGGPRLGRYLEEHYEWELADVLHQETSKKESAKGIDVKHDVSLRDIANRTPLKADMIDPKRLRVLVSRSAQKNGEMSTGQRWCTCMVSDGPSFGYVLKGIALGVIVAYVIHEDDVEGRYPLMRMLLNPFGNKRGQFILVPAQAYGGDGAENSRTCDALRGTVNKFASKQNVDKEGEFYLDPRLYADSQMPVVLLQKDWSQESIKDGLARFQEVSLRDWLEELMSNEELLQQGKRGPHDEDPAAKIAKLKKNICRFFDAQDPRNGLPRMFFRETAKTSIGSIPKPLEILEAVKDSTFTGRQLAFESLRAGDGATWSSVTNGWGDEMRYRTAYAAILTSETEDPSVRLSTAAAYALEVQKILKRAKESAGVRKNPSGLNAALVKRLKEVEGMAKTRPDFVDDAIVEMLSDRARRDVNEPVRQAASKALQSILEIRSDLEHATRRESMAKRLKNTFLVWTRSQPGLR
jgi:hypothetical protein